jgi:hypothetical protein
MSDSATQSPGSVTRRLKPALTTFRAMATALAIVVVLQPISIGLYLDGDYAAMSLHEIGASAVLFIALFTLVAAIWYAVVAQRRAWVPIMMFLLLLTVGAQTGFGYGRFLGAHVPLGVGVVAGCLALVWWAWAAAGKALPKTKRVKP